MGRGGLAMVDTRFPSTQKKPCSGISMQPCCSGWKKEGEWGRGEEPRAMAEGTDVIALVEGVPL